MMWMRGEAPINFLLAGLLLLVPLVVVNPMRVNRETTWSRWIGIGFAVALTLVNQVYIVIIVIELVNGRIDGPSILLTAFAVWITNVIAFALVYWELDSGGPYARPTEAGTRGRGVGGGYAAR